MPATFPRGLPKPKRKLKTKARKAKSQARPRAGTIIGDFSYVKPLSDGKHHAFICTLCSKKRRFTLAHVRDNPDLTCTEPGCPKPEDAQDNRKSPKSPSKPTKVDLEKLDKARSSFQENMPEALRVLDSVSASSDSASDRVTVKMLLELIPAAERRYRTWSTQSNAYALNSFLTQLREILADLQSTEGRDELMAQVTQEIVLGAVQNIAQTLADQHRETVMFLNTYISDEHREKVEEKLGDITIANGKRVQGILEEAQMRIVEGLIDPAAAKKTAGTRSGKGNSRTVRRSRRLTAPGSQ